MSNRRLSSDFVIELIQTCLKNTKVLDVCVKHLKYHYLYDEPQKKVFRFMFSNYDVTNQVPTIGIIGQHHATDKDVINLLSQVKKIVYNPEGIESILDTFEVFIKDSRFRVLYDKVGDLYNQGDQDEAISLLSKESGEIKEFSLSSTYYSTVFKDYEERQDSRGKDNETALMEKLTFGIHELDEHTFGGFNKGTSVLHLARSGAGKSTFLRWVGLCNARVGRRVVHFQAEGTEQECLDAYDAGWTSIDLRDVEFGVIPKARREKIIKAHKNIMSSGGEIYVFAAETFDSMTVQDARNILIDIIETIGPVDLAIFDYLELFGVAGESYTGESGERRRREAIANKFTNIAVEFKIGVVTAIQAMDLAPDLMNNPDFVYTRHHISEFKNVVKPFSYFVTHNQTRDEYENQIARLYCDKFRKYKSGQTIRFYQSLSNSRYYNSGKTLKEFYHKN